MKNSIKFIYILIIYSSLGVRSDSLSEKNHSELSDTMKCKVCSLIVEKFDSNLEVDFLKQLAELENVLENIQPFCKSLQKIEPDLNCNLLNQFPNSKELTCGYLTNYCSQDFHGMYRNKFENCRNIFLKSNFLEKEIQNIALDLLVH